MLCALLFLLLGLGSVSPAVHLWLHAASHDSDCPPVAAKSLASEDHCAIVLLAHGLLAPIDAAGPPTRHEFLFSFTPAPSENSVRVFRRHAWPPAHAPPLAWHTPST